MKIQPIKLTLVLFLHLSLNSFSQTLPPGIANRNIHWVQNHPMGPQVIGNGVDKPLQTEQEKSGEDWWYDVRPIYENSVQVGYMVCGFASHKNYYFDETNMSPQGFLRSPSTVSNPTHEACEHRVERDEYLSQYQQHIGRYDLNGNSIWCKHVNNGGPLMSLINTNDGGFIAIGETMAAYDMDNVPLIYNPNGLAGQQPLTTYVDLTKPQTPPNTLNYYEKGRINVVKFNSNGEVEWNYIYGHVDLDISGTSQALENNSVAIHNQKLYGLDIDITNDANGYVILAISENANTQMQELLAIRIDLNGIVQTKALIGPPTAQGYQLWARAMDCEGGNCYITGAMTGQGFSNLPNDNKTLGFLLKINDQNLSVSSSWGTPWSANNPIRYNPEPTAVPPTSTILQDIVVNPNGEIVCGAIKKSSGCFYSGENHGIGTILKFNTSGTIVNSNSFGPVRAYDMKIGLTKLASQEYAIVSSKRSVDATNNELIPNLSVAPYADILDDYNSKVDYTCDEYNMLIGTWNTDTYIAKFNENLSLVWETQFDSDDKEPVNHPGDFKKQECMYRIAEGADGSLVAVGNSSHNVDDFLFVKVFSDCQSLLNYDIDNITPITTQTWSSDKTVIGKVIIPSGQTLTISNCTIEFADSKRVNVDTKIVIEQGGRLIINNSTLTSIQSCEKAMWDGIEVQGDPTKNQITTLNQGYLSITNNSIISNARNAVTTTARNDDNTVNWNKTGGGIITATNSSFVDNYASFGFMKYTPHNTSGAVINDASSILKCSFTTTTNFGDGGMTTKPYAQIIMWDTKNIRIQGNKFMNTRFNVLANERGIGILSVDAAFVVKPACNGVITYPGGCDPNNEVANEFHDLYTGIAISNVNNSSFTIDKTLFKNNLYGVRVEGAQFGEIIRSNFVIPNSFDLSETKYAFGVYSDGASVVKIEENKFNGNYNGIGRNMGVFIKNSDAGGAGVSNYLNDYTGLSIGTQEAGNNLSLQIDCNRFYKTSTISLVDIHVANGLIAVQGVCNQPGNIPDPKLPHANEFYGICDNSTYNQLRNTGTSVFEYNSYALSDVGFDVGCMNGSINGQNCLPLIAYVRQKACASSITSIGDGKLQKNQISTNKNLISTYKNKVDGGDSDALIALINASTNPEELKNQLFSISPYLSTQAQLAVINKSLPSEIKKQILEINAPFKENVRIGIINSTMSNSVKNQLMAIAYGESPLDILEKTVHHYENEQRLATNDLMKMYLDSNYVDSVSFALKERNGIERSKLLITTLLQQNQSEVSRQLNIVAKYADSISLRKPDEARELLLFHDFYSSLLSIVNRSGGYFNLTSEELLMIKNIASEDYSLSPMASSILNFRDSKLPYVDGFELDGTKMMVSGDDADKWIPLEETISSIVIYPNPSTGWFEISFEDKNNEVKTIEVYNLEGKLLALKKSNEQTLVVDLSDLFSGIYVAKITAIQSGVESIYTERIVVAK